MPVGAFFRVFEDGSAFMLSSLSTPAAEMSRKAYSRVLQAMQEPGTARNLAQILGVSKATISRTKTEKLEDA